MDIEELQTPPDPTHYPDLNEAALHLAHHALIIQGSTAFHGATVVGLAEFLDETEGLAWDYSRSDDDRFDPSDDFDEQLRKWKLRKGACSSYYHTLFADDEAPQNDRGGL